MHLSSLTPEPQVSCNLRYPAVSIIGLFRMHVAKSSWKLQAPEGFEEWGRGDFAWTVWAKKVDSALNASKGGQAEIRWPKICFTHVSPWDCWQLLKLSVLRWTISMLFALQIGHKARCGEHQRLMSNDFQLEAPATSKVKRVRSWRLRLGWLPYM